MSVRLVFCSTGCFCFWMEELPSSSTSPSVNTQSPWLQCQTGWLTALNMMYELWTEAHAHTLTHVNLSKAFQGPMISLFWFVLSAFQERRRDLFVLNSNVFLNQEVISEESKFVAFCSDFKAYFWSNTEGHHQVIMVQHPQLIFGLTAWQAGAARTLVQLVQDQPSSVIGAVAPPTGHSHTVTLDSCVPLIGLMNSSFTHLGPIHWILCAHTWMCMHPAGADLSRHTWDPLVLSKYIDTIFCPLLLVLWKSTGVSLNA